MRNLVTCARDGGNYLLNIGPRPDGSIPEESVRILTAVGKWMDRNGDSHLRSRALQGGPLTLSRTSRARATRSTCTSTSGRARRCAIGGLTVNVKSARLLTTGAKVTFDQDRFRLRFTGLPPAAPDNPVTVIAAECDGEPAQDMDMIRKERPRTRV